LYIDSMGKNRPLPGISPEERIAMDMVVQDFLMLTAKIYIYVTGPLLASEIREIDEVYNRLKMINSEATMFLIHNFKDFFSEAEIQKHIKDDINDGFVAEQIDDYVWKSHNLDVYHLVIARDGSTAATKWNQKSIDYLKNYITANRYNFKEMDIMSDIKKTVNHLLHQYLYLPDTNPDLPVFMDPIEIVYEGHIGSLIYRSWVESVEYLKDYFSSIISYFSKVEGDPFEVDIVTTANRTFLSLVKNHESINYAPLGKHKELDKSFPIKMDIIQNDNSYVYVLDIPGVSAGNLSVNCDGEQTQTVSIAGIRTIPEIYRKYLKQNTDMKRQDRRFNSFKMVLDLPSIDDSNILEGQRKLTCERRNQTLKNGVLYLYFWYPEVVNTEKIDLK